MGGFQAVGAPQSIRDNQADICEDAQALLPKTLPSATDLDVVVEAWDRLLRGRPGQHCGVGARIQNLIRLSAWDVGSSYPTQAQRDLVAILFSAAGRVEPSRSGEQAMAKYSVERVQESAMPPVASGPKPSISDRFQMKRWVEERFRPDIIEFYDEEAHRRVDGQGP